MASRRERTCLAGQPSFKLRRCPKGRFASAADLAALRRASGLEPSGRRSTTALQSEEGRAGRRVRPAGQQERSADAGTSPSGSPERHPQCMQPQNWSFTSAPHLCPAFGSGACRNGAADSAVALIQSEDAGQTSGAGHRAIRKPPASRHRPPSNACHGGDDRSSNGDERRPWRNGRTSPIASQRTSRG